MIDEEFEVEPELEKVQEPVTVSKKKNEISVNRFAYLPPNHSHKIILSM